VVEIVSAFLETHHENVTSKPIDQNTCYIESHNYFSASLENGRAGGILSVTSYPIVTMCVIISCVCAIVSQPYWTLYVQHAREMKQQTTESRILVCSRYFSPTHTPTFVCHLAFYSGLHCADMYVPTPHHQLPITKEDW